tara:strand:+ start:387 stop:1115 length:729 start_codon:yes stop_codon:yes gene_type:complete
MDKKEFRVGVTKDYNMFEFLDTNRQPNTRIIKKLEKSIKEHGVQIPIIVNDKKQIVDGQHRFWALRKLGYQVPYIISYTWKEDIHTIEINNTGHRWTSMDYANYAAESGNLDVDEALKIAKTWEKQTQKKLRPITALEILMEGRSHAGLKTKLKNLTYKIDRDRGFQVLESLTEMSQHPMKANPYSARIARTIKILNYDEDDLDEQVIASMCQSNYITTYDSETDQLEYFRDIYNKAKSKMK